MTAGRPGRLIKFACPLTGARLNGIVGNWSDAANDEYGDLLDVTQQSRGLEEPSTSI